MLLEGESVLSHLTTENPEQGGSNKEHESTLAATNGENTVASCRLRTFTRDPRSSTPRRHDHFRRCNEPREDGLAAGSLRCAHAHFMLGDIKTHDEPEGARRG